MATLTIRDLPDETVAAFRVLAAHNGRSMEAEAREVIRAAVFGVSAEPLRPAAERVKAAQDRVRAMFGGELPKGMVDEYLAERRAAARAGQ